MASEVSTAVIESKSGSYVYVDDGTGERNIGPTMGDTIITTTPTWRDRKAQQFGDTPVDNILQGVAATVKFQMYDLEVDNLLLAIPFGQKYVSGDQEAMGVGIPVGTSLRDNAVAVRIHPINSLSSGDDDPTYLDDDYNFWMAASMEAVEEGYADNTEDKTFDVTLMILPDFTKPTLYNLYGKGDPSVIGTLDITPPTVVLKAEVSDVETVIPAAGLGTVDADTTIIALFDELVTESMFSAANAPRYMALIKDSDNSTIAGAFAISTVTGTPDVSKVVFTPTSALTSAAVYYVIVADVQDIAKNPMAGAVIGKITIA